MAVEWWEARGSTVLHARDVDGKKLANSAMCSRSMIWLKPIEGSKLTSRCGYCTYAVKAASKAE